MKFNMNIKIVKVLIKNFSFKNRRTVADEYGADSQESGGNTQSTGTWYSTGTQYARKNS